MSDITTDNQRQPAPPPPPPPPPRVDPTNTEATAKGPTARSTATATRPTAAVRAAQQTVDATRVVASNQASQLRDRLQAETRRLDVPTPTPAPAHIRPDATTQTAAAVRAPENANALASVSRSDQRNAVDALDRDSMRNNRAEQVGAHHSSISGRTAPANASTPETRAAQAPREPTPEDRARRDRVIDTIRQRMAGRTSRYTPEQMADRMANALGNGDPSRGMRALESALARGRLNVGMAGINGLGGGDRRPDQLDDLGRHMGRATGQEIDAVLDNNHGRHQARPALANQNQVQQLRDITDVAGDLGLPVNVVAHSNGFNALAQFSRENPNARLGNVSIINPNIPADRNTATQNFRDIVARSENVHLVTTRADEAVPWSQAGRTNPRVWESQVNAAAAAGVHRITVLNRAHHSVESVAGHLANGDGPYDFRRDASGRTVPVDPKAWERDGYSWTPEGGLRWLTPRERQQQRRRAA